MGLEKLSLQKWIDGAKAADKSLGEFVLSLQAEQLEITETELLARMNAALQIMERSIRHGLTGVRSMGGLAGGDGLKILNYAGAKPALLTKAAAYAVAVGEANAAMGKICAAPTAGSSGVIPGVFFSLKEEGELPEESLPRALVTAGAIGMVVASRASLSGAEGGCQAECGSAAAMAAGAVTDALGGSPDQAGHAVAMCLKNMLGLVCDPVAGLVEVPCVKRNAGAAAQALVAVNMALAGVESRIPVDEVIDAMEAVGREMPKALRETAKGGLAVTPSGNALAARLLDKN